MNLNICYRKFGAIFKMYIKKKQKKDINYIIGDLGLQTKEISSKRDGIN